ncbi:MAG TPA: sulfatase-like hydrolase/transferase, partial [Gaiellaceae bacterium]|nr:sulfatase-like hydrolase/transferase [Gaiellaceae bacterium]
KRLGFDGTTVLVVGAVAIGLTVALAMWKLAPARSFLNILVVAPFVFLAFFLFNTPVEHLVFPNAQARAAAANVRKPTPIVFLLFDEFPTISLEDEHGDIDAGRFPNFARFARSALWFRNMTTVASSTTVAVPALLTGRFPKKGSLPVYQDHPNNLFTLLGKRYRLHVVETQTSLCPARLCKRKQPSAETRLSSLWSDGRTVYLHLIAPPSLEARLPAIDESWADFGSDTGGRLEGSVKPPKVNLRTFYIGRLHDFNTWLAKLRPPGSTPSLDYLHILFPHGPWLYFPDGRVRAVAVPRAPGRTEERWWNESLAEQAWQRHLLQVGFADKLLGRFVARLHKTGLWDRALVIVTVDEGDSFRGGDNRRDPSKTNLGDIAFIPLFLKLPGADQGRVVERHVSSVDLVPTIASLLGVKIGWRVDGRSVLASGPGSPTVRVNGYTTPFSTADRLRQRARERKLELFGSGSWGPGLSGSGRYRGLVGKPVGTVQVAGTRTAGAKLDGVGSRLLRSLPRRSQLIPSPLAGSVTGLRPGDSVAFALNGRIAAVSQVYRELDTGALRFSALPPASAFTAGQNRLRAFLVGGPASAPRLREVHIDLSG